MKILITGGGGQLGREIFDQAQNNYVVLALNRQYLDITDEKNVRTVISEYKPDVIIHTAAYTAVDQCEIEQHQAMNVNVLGTLNVAKACEEIEAKMVYISTDYVFSGEKKTPYNEYDIPKPLNFYGMSKWLGEELVLSTLSNPYIVRTSWLYGSFGNNFVKTIIRLASIKEEIYVIDDQIGSPSCVRDVAQTILTLLNKEPGIYHVTNSGECSWYEFAKATLELSGDDQKKIKPIPTNEYGQAATRPSYSVLGHSGIEKQGIPRTRHWKEALMSFLGKEIDG